MLESFKYLLYRIAISVSAGREAVASSQRNWQSLRHVRRLTLALPKAQALPRRSGDFHQYLSQDGLDAANWLPKRELRNSLKS
jgi:hypothetical protein